MPTFCRHNRFLERCPICSKTLPGRSPSAATSSSAKRTARATSARTRRPRAGAEDLRIRREGRAEDDGYRCALVPGLRASADAHALALEIAFASGRLLALATEPPGMYGEIRDTARHDLERATWICFVVAYLGPLQGGDPFAGARAALAGAGAPGGDAPPGAPQPGTLEGALQEVPLGPRTSHDPARGTATLVAYRQWVARSGSARGAGDAPEVGAQAAALAGDATWSPERRFQRLFERLALPGLARMGRYDLLVTLGRLGLYELRPDALHFAAGGGQAGQDLTTLAAKRLFGIGDPLLLERRAAALAEAATVPLETLDLALANWQSPERATMGVAADTCDEGALARARDALDL